MIDDCLNDVLYEEGRKNVKEETWAYCGDGAKLAADYLIGKYESIIAKDKEQSK